MNRSSGQWVSLIHYPQPIKTSQIKNKVDALYLLQIRKLGEKYQAATLLIDIFLYLHDAIGYKTTTLASLFLSVFCGTKIGERLSLSTCPKFSTFSFFFLRDINIFDLIMHLAFENCIILLYSMNVKSGDLFRLVKLSQ